MGLAEGWVWRARCTGRGWGPWVCSALCDSDREQGNGKELGQGRVSRGLAKSSAPEGGRHGTSCPGQWARPHAARVQGVSHGVWILGGPVQSQESDSMIPVSSFQLRIFYGSMNVKTSTLTAGWVQSLELRVVFEVSWAMWDISRGCLTVGAPGEPPPTASPAYSSLILLGTLWPSLV